MTRRTVLLDRDGVINVYRPGRYVSTPEDLEYNPGALAALKRLADAGYPVIVISNQAGVGKGLLPMEMLEAITRKMIEDVAAAGGRIGDVLYCPHRPEENCDCRKPQPGMIEEAAERHGFDPRRAVFVGDSVTDIQAAHAAGCTSIMILTGQAGRKSPGEWGVQPDFVETDLPSAVERILNLP